jgi:hypothetical protein
MQIRLLILAMLLLISRMLYSQVSITNDGTTPDNSAMLDVKSTTKGMLVPRMTQSERNCIPSPATGLIVYQTDGDMGLYSYDGTNWVSTSKINDQSTSNYIRIGNVQIVYGITSTTDISTWITVTFPMAFSEVPTITATFVGTAGIYDAEYYIYNLTDSSFDAYLFSSWSNIYFHWQAIGRWQ